jgi:folylpolyglutamate synthase/dihydropteroate synthase
MADKDTDMAASIISKMAASIYTVTPANARSLPAAEYVAKFKKYGVLATPCETVGDGVRAAIADAVANNRPLIISGSLFLYEEVLRELDAVCPTL